jgi:hypothetical protein
MQPNIFPGSLPKLLLCAAAAAFLKDILAPGKRDDIRQKKSSFFRLHEFMITRCTFIFSLSDTLLQSF